MAKPQFVSIQTLAINIHLYIHGMSACASFVFMLLTTNNNNYNYFSNVSRIPRRFSFKLFYTMQCSALVYEYICISADHNPFQQRFVSLENAPNFCWSRQRLNATSIGEKLQFISANKAEFACIYYLYKFMRQQINKQTNNISLLPYLLLLLLM